MTEQLASTHLNLRNPLCWSLLQGWRSAAVASASLAEACDDQSWWHELPGIFHTGGCMHWQPLRSFPTHDLSHECAIDPGTPVGNGQMYRSCLIEMILVSVPSIINWTKDSNRYQQTLNHTSDILETWSSSFCRWYPTTSMQTVSEPSWRMLATEWSSNNVAFCRSTAVPSSFLWTMRATCSLRRLDSSKMCVGPEIDRMGIPKFAIFIGNVITNHGTG